MIRYYKLQWQYASVLHIFDAGTSYYKGVDSIPLMKANIKRKIAKKPAAVISILHKESKK